MVNFWTFLKNRKFAMATVWEKIMLLFTPTSGHTDGLRGERTTLHLLHQV